ncbi:hypothetical protein F4781DRAFT_402867 [Annulohypoxylon bovei var. microspora]|nr:hypothetical protein F4781DRAFT_402867 [Annulohypoxylon bovei var. microspora]
MRAKFKNPSEPTMVERLLQFSGAELREIVLSVCLNSRELYRLVVGYVDLTEAEKGTGGADDYLGVRLQLFAQKDVIALVLFILEKDHTDSTRKIINRLVRNFESRKAVINSIS